MKKKVVFVIESLHLGGAEKSLVTLLNLLSPDEYEIDLILFSKNNFFDEFVPSYVQVIYKSFPSLSFLERVQFKLKRLVNKKVHTAQLLWDLVSNKFELVDKVYDIAIAYNQGFATYYTSKYIKASASFAWINTDYIHAGYQIRRDIGIYKQYTKVVCVSEQAKESFEKALGAISTNLPIEVIKDISDPDIVRKQAEKPLKVTLNKEQINILTVARLAKPKGLYMAIDACKILKDLGYDIYWRVVGEGSERRALQEKINTLGLQDCFSLLGSDNNPYPYMKACDIYVQSSLFEGLGLTVIEASYLNKPIVCTNFPTAYGILKNEETGLICEMSSQAIAKDIERLILDEDLRESLCLNLSNQFHEDKFESLRLIQQLFNHK